MLKLLSLLVLPSLVFASSSDEKLVPSMQNKACEDYVIVSEKLFDCYENAIPYAQNRDKKHENGAIKTLEELEKDMHSYEKKPLAKSVSGEENSGIESVFATLDEKFGYMYELKAKLDAREKESAKMWSEYYAIKEAYDRAVAKYVEKWAEDNGILLSKNRSGMQMARFRK